MRLIWDIGGVELRQLEYFVAVAEERSFTRAANRLHLAQSGVSATIKALESELGIQLFDRDSKRVELTPAGVELFGRAGEVLLATRRAVDAIDAVRGGLSGHVRIGTMTAHGFIDLPAMLGDFRTKHPGVRFTLTFARRGSTDLADAVATGSLDLAIASLPGYSSSRILQRELGSAPMDLVVPAEHPLASTDDVRLEDLNGETFVDLPVGYGSRRVVDDAFDQAQLHREIAVEVADAPSGIGYVAHGLGIAILPRFTITSSPAVRQIRIRSPDLRWPLSVATSTRHHPSAATNALLDEVANYILPQR
jgi:DNA-binding transcriptional LysR family regulator